MPRAARHQLHVGAIFLLHGSPRLTRPLQLNGQQLIDVSDNIAELTRVTGLSVSSRFSFWFALTPSLQLDDNALAAIPAGVFVMTQLTTLYVRCRRRRCARLLTRRCAADEQPLGRDSARDRSLDGVDGAVGEAQPRAPRRV